MALRVPSLRSLTKLTPRKTAIIAVVLISPIVVAGLAARGKDQPVSGGQPAPSGGAPAVQVTPAQDAKEDNVRTKAEAQAAAALVQCRTARLVPVGKAGWGVPAPSVWKSTSTDCNLMYGDNPNRGAASSGDPDTAIRTLQRNLNFCYGYHLTVDGVYGSNTRGVVKAVQRKHKLTADGIYGPNTRSAMNWRLFSTKTNTWSKTCSSPL